MRTRCDKSATTGTRDPGSGWDIREGGVARAPACRTVVFSAGTRVPHPGRLVVIVPGGRHSSTPIRRSLPWLGSLVGISYLFDPTSCVARPPVLVAALDPHS